MFQPRTRDVRRVEVARVGPEPDPGAGVALAHLGDLFERLHGVAVLERHRVLGAGALDPAFQATGQRVDHRYTYPVQPARKRVVLARELAAGVQPGHDQLDPGQLVLRVRVHRHAAPVVGHRYRAVGVQRDVDAPGVAGQRHDRPEEDTAELQT